MPLLAVPLRAVALWLDDHGTAGLFARPEEFSMAYQAERAELEPSDITSLVIRALNEEYAKYANQAKYAKSQVGIPPTEHKMQFTAGMLRNAALEMINAEDMDLTEGDVTPQKIGKVLHKLRLRKPVRPSGRGPRLWEVTLAELQRWTSAHGLGEIGVDESSDITSEDPPPELGILGALGILGIDEPSAKAAREVFCL